MNARRIVTSEPDQALLRPTASQWQRDRARGPIQPMPFTRRSVVAQITDALFSREVARPERPEPLSHAIGAGLCLALLVACLLILWSLT